MDSTFTPLQNCQVELGLYVERFLEFQLVWAKKRIPLNDAPVQLAKKFKSYCSELANSWKTPEFDPYNYSKGIVALGVENQPVLKGILEHRFFKGETILHTAYTLGYCERQLRRTIKRLPFDISDHLFQLNFALLDDDPKNMNSYQRTKISQLEIHYHLSTKQASILWTFMANRGKEMGRKAIAEKFCVSQETLRDHITKIIHHVHAKNMMEAVNIVVERMNLDMDSYSIE